MGPELGEATNYLEHGTNPKREIDQWDGWLAILSSMAISKPIGEPFVRLHSEGWIVDPTMFKKLRNFVAPKIVPLQPGEPGFLFFASAGDRARKTLAQWETAHEEDVLYLMVPDSQHEKDAHWLTQPVPLSWITEHTPAWVLEQYEHSSPQQPEHLMYRAAFIARTGTIPEFMVSPFSSQVVTEG
jgi:hypothetical protein